MGRRIVILASGLLAAVLLIAAGAGFWYERPTRLTVAISGYDTEDTALIEAAAQSLKSEKKPVRLHIQIVADPAAASKAVDDGLADLAVIRTDVAVPEGAATVVILHRDAALLVAPAAGAIHAISDLPGHTVGMVRRGVGNEKLLEAVLGQYDIAPDAVKTVALEPEEVAHAVETKAVDAVLAVDVASNQRLRDIVMAVASASGGAPFFVPITEADAIAQRSSIYEKASIVKGIFGGAPPRPSKEFDTIAVTHRLIADEDVDTGVITELTRFLLTKKQQLGNDVPVALQIEAPSTDKGAPMPVHAGAAAYIDDDEETFFDKYSDFIYIGAMLIGVLASGATAIFSQIGRRRTAFIESGVSRLLAMLMEVRAETSVAVLDVFQVEADSLLASALSAASSGDDGRLTSFSLALEQVRAAIRDRRAQLREPVPHLLARAAE